MESISFIKILKTFFFNLEKKRQRQILFLFLLVILAAFAETISLASAFPFLQIIIDQSYIWENNFLNSFLLFLGINRSDNIIFPICVLFGSTAFFAGVIKSYNLWYGIKISSLISSDLSYLCFKQNLYQNYENSIEKNSSDLITNNTVFINEANAIFSSSARLLSNIIIGLCISIYLIFLNTKLALSSIFIFIIAYFLIGKFLQKKLLKNSILIEENSKRQTQIIQESIGSFRDILLNSNQKYFLNIYKNIDYDLKAKNAENIFYNLFPRYAIESLFLLILSILVFFISLRSTDFVNIIAILGSFAIGGQKLLPCMQQSYGTWSYIIGSKYLLINILKLSNQKQDISLINYEPKIFDFKDKIKLNNICFKYSGTENYILKNFNLEISKGEKIGIIGQTGVGKSTVVDIIIGLLEPTNGSLVVDEKNIYDYRYPQRRLDWRRNIAHVPQKIFLNDATIAENIAFGESLKEINLRKVQEAAKKAEIHQYISKQALNYFGRIGENGIKLSGGQMQRIGLARAFYKSSEIIVLDEATSALDTFTESKIIDTVFKSSKNITIILVTHRENSIKACDKVVRISHSRLIK